MQTLAKHFGLAVEP